MVAPYGNFANIPLFSLTRPDCFNILREKIDLWNYRREPRPAQRATVSSRELHLARGYLQRYCMVFDVGFVITESFQ